MSSDSSPFEAFQRAVRKAGGQKPFSDICGCTQSNISQLLTKKRVLPAGYVLAVEAATRVSRYDLRPDIYPRDPRAGVLATSFHPRNLGGGAAAVACDRRRKLQPEPAL